MTAAIPAERAAERLQGLIRRLDAWQGFPEAAAELVQGRPAAFEGVWGSSCALLAAGLQQRLTGPLLIVCARPDDVDDIADDLRLFLSDSTSVPPILRFPAWDSEPDERAVRDEVYGERLRTLKWLLSPPQLYEAPAEVKPEKPSGPPLKRFLKPPPTSANKASDPSPTPNATSNPAPAPILLAPIAALLQPAPSVDALRAASRVIRRGERVDVEELLRWLVERGFHATTAVELPGEFSHRGGILDIFGPDWLQPVRVELFDDEIESLRQFDVGSQRSLAQLQQIEVTVLSPRDPAERFLTDYLPANAAVLLVEPDQIQEEGTRYLQHVATPQAYHSVHAVQAEYQRFGLATASAISEGADGVTCALPVESVERFSGDISKVRDEFDQLAEGYEVLIVTQTEAEIQRLREILSSTQAAARGTLYYPLGRLAHGFRLVQDHLIVITSNELFHRGELRRTPVRRLGKALDSFLDLREGDLVVHLAHGVARYRGLKLIERQGQQEEHLELEFAEGTKIYVPAIKIDLVQKYIGGSKSSPTLAKIGGKAWVRQKKAAESAVQDLAAEMLELQAARASRPGIAFNRDTEWQHEFDASFPYQETPDQLSAISAIKEDMLRARPMDRLLCGDVGFGKTEVSMRAAFKAVDSGYQVAVLVPTTILCEQHYHSFKERMAEFPFDIGKLSRFCTTQEEKHTLAGLKRGNIDIVIGTHRVASQDVQFHNLGLVIIDEEQRFGVDVKERLKQLRTQVDVLTMSATPIPRTLHMSLVGVRDISNLETPPEDRLAVETKVTRWNEELIRHAIQRELARGGQIYFVHNRVNDIELIAERLKMIVPDVRLRIGHGQMAEDELEEVMVDFINHRFDLLVATTIVESGLDIPNANTIFIDEADRYGLADLHQLRGRVGRYKHRAYCYLLLERGKHITPTASRRLKAIEEFSEMGAGFAIAMRDLEIRGAGNLLGTQQSGHIAAVGYELYCQLLENAVRQLKQLPPRVSLDVDLNLPGDAFLPPDYVDDMRLKIDFYRRLTRVTTYEELASMREELQDRFGPPPPPAERLLTLAELKMDAAVWHVSAIQIEEQFLVFRYANRARIEQLARDHKGKLRIVDDKSAYLPISPEQREPDRLLRLVKSVLRAGEARR